MWPCRSLPDSHHTFKASAQKSLVSRDRVKINVSAPVASINTPKGVHFVPAGGSWSHAAGVLPSESVRLFPPPRVVPLVDLRLGVDGDLQRLGVGAGLPAGGAHVGEDGVGLLGLLQRLGLLDQWLHRGLEAAEFLTYPLCQLGKRSGGCPLRHGGPHHATSL